MSRITEAKEVFSGDPMKFFVWSEGIVGKLTEENCVGYALAPVPMPDVR
jgi:hypothetical protein